MMQCMKCGKDMPDMLGDCPFCTITQLQAELEKLKERIKAMYVGDLSPESRLNGYKIIVKAEQKRRNELIELLKKHRWIPVTERLPEGKGVWLVLKRGIPETYRKNDESVLWRGFADEFSHWKPIILP